MNKFAKAITGFLATVILVSGLSFGTLFAASVDPQEPNNSMSKATSMTMGKTYNGEIGSLKTYGKNHTLDEDWFKIKLTAGVIYRVTMTGYNKHFKNTTLLIDVGNKEDFDKDRHGAISLRNDFETNGDFADFSCSKSGTAYIKIWNYFDYPDGKNTTTYKLKIEVSPNLYLANGKTITGTVVAGSKLTLIPQFSNATFSSSNNSIATVDANGKVSAKQGGTVIITATNGSVTATCRLLVLYKDVTDSSDFWYDPTYYLTDRNVVKGYDKQTKFKPGNDCTRAQMVTFLWRLNGSPAPKSTSCKFTDVKTSAYYYKAVLWAVENGITTGVSKTKFKPSGVCTRAQTVTFLWRMAGKPSIGSAKNPFKDVKKSDYFYNAVIWASNKKIVAGYKNGTFKPSGKCLRRQMVTFLYKYDKNVNGK